jgi:hypothetical protein
MEEISYPYLTDEEMGLSPNLDQGALLETYRKDVCMLLYVKELGYIPYPYSIFDISMFNQRVYRIGMSLAS